MIMQPDNLDLIILKTLITNKKYAIEFINECDTKIFSSDVWKFADLITNYTKTYKELPTLNVIKDKHEKSNPKLFDYAKDLWTKIEQVEHNDKEYHYNLKKLKDRFAEKEFSKLNTLLSSNKDVPNKITDLQRTISNIRNASQVKNYDSKTLKEAIPFFVDKFNAKKENPKLETGMKLHYEFLDHAINGVKPADFVMVAGASGYGKSLVLANLAVNAWLQDNRVEDGAPFSPGKNIVYFSLEMPYEDCFNRLIARLSKVASRKIENAQVNKEEFSKIKQALTFINSYPNHFKIIDIADATANDIELIISELDFSIDAAFVDYVGLMKPNEMKKDIADWQAQSEVAYELRAIGRKYNIPMFSAVQLNRKGNANKEDNGIGLDRLARSAGIASHCTTVLQIENRPNEIAFPDLQIHIIKNRKGIKGKGTLIKHFGCAYLEDVPLSDTEKEYDAYALNTDSNMDSDISDQVEDLEL